MIFVISFMILDEHRTYTPHASPTCATLFWNGAFWSQQQDLSCLFSLISLEKALVSFLSFKEERRFQCFLKQQQDKAVYYIISQSGNTSILMVTHQTHKAFSLLFLPVDSLVDNETRERDESLDPFKKRVLKQHHSTKQSWQALFLFLLSRKSVMSALLFRIFLCFVRFAHFFFFVFQSRHDKMFPHHHNQSANMPIKCITNKSGAWIWDGGLWKARSPPPSCILQFGHSRFFSLGVF
jgi:hypothetical protein